MIAITLAQLYVYPIKSCGGYMLEQAELLINGLKHDRTFMVVDAQTGHFVTQRTLPQMALISTEYKLGTIVVRAPGMLRLDLPLDVAGEAMQVTVWDDTVDAFDMGEVAAQWFSIFLKRPLRLVRFDPAFDRICNRDWTGTHQARVEFADGYPLLVISNASLSQINQRLPHGVDPVAMSLFRPNIVLDGLEPFEEDAVDTLQFGEVVLKLVKPCTRCEIPNIEQTTGQRMQEPMGTLGDFRSNAKMNGAVCVGMNAIVIAGAGDNLSVNQSGKTQIAF